MTQATERAGRPRPPLSSVTGLVAAAGWPFRLALAMGLLLIGSFLSVLYDVTTVVGGGGWLAAVVCAAFAFGVVMALRVSLRVGLAATVVLFGLGTGGYLLAIPNLYEAFRSLQLLFDFVALLLGDMSLLQIFRADLWAVMMAPAPVYGTWYLLLRRHYGLSVWLGGAPLVFFMLTGDASEAVSMVGTTAALGVLGFGTLDRSGATWEQVRELGFVLAAAVLVTRLSRPVASRLTATSRPSVGGESGEAPAYPYLEDSLMGAPGQVAVRGRISLSPALRFTVTAERASFWHVDAYDRFTGRGWLRSGMTTQYTGPLPSPPGQTGRLVQTFRAEAPATTLPAAWKPVRVRGAMADRTRVSDLGGLQPTEVIAPGESFTVASEVRSWSAEQLDAADQAVPESLRRRYLQLPGDTPDRIGVLARELTRGAETTYRRAVRIQAWLEENKDYSLDVQRPSGNVADAFVFDMDRGYCVYFATAMTVMLRSLGIPARFATGYATGEQVGETRWEVRGLHSHTWVQVYFAGFGWVTFDPTPSDPREAARRQRLEEARREASIAFDFDRTTTPSPGISASLVDELADSTPRVGSNTTPTVSIGEQTAADGRAGSAESGVSRRGLFTGLSGSDRLTILAGLVGLALGATRFKLLHRGYRLLAIRRQWSSGSPGRDVERAFTRVEWLLARQYRERRPGETRRAYINAVRQSGIDDPRLQHILDGYETARYRGDRSWQQANEVIELVDAFVRDHQRIWPAGRRSRRDD